MTLQQAIKKYNLKKQETCFDGEPLPKNYELFIGEKTTEKAKYFYVVDRNGKNDHYILVIQAFYFGENKETMRTYILEN